MAKKATTSKKSSPAPKVEPETTSNVAVDTRGFKRFMPRVSVPKDVLEAKLSKLSSDNLYVFWTGTTYNGRETAGSGRARILHTITEVRSPVHISELIRRAASLDGGGYLPDQIRSGAFLHRGSKPAVYILGRKADDGTFKAAARYPYPDPAMFGKDGRLEPGDPLPAELVGSTSKAVATTSKRKGRK